LPLIEEYVDRELKGRTAEQVAAHLSSCAACAAEAAAFERDAEIYARYQRDLEVTPAHWNIIRARIEQEKDARPAEKQRRGWLAGLFGSERMFRPAFIAALVLVAVGITAGIIYLNSRERQSQIAAQAPKQNVIPAPSGTSEVTIPGKENENGNTIAQDESKERSNSNQTVASKAPHIKRRDMTPPVQLADSANRRIKQPTPDESVRFEEASANSNNIITDVRQGAPEVAGDFDLEIARHAERAEVLLRSFRNARPATTGRTLDLSYEKENARKLLFQNIALRRDAASRGDQPAANLLNTLEPILLDIAHLPDRARPTDVRSIEERMRKKEIVAALQVRTLVASN
jgi:anti-sigma factor RsiW